MLLLDLDLFHKSAVFYALCYIYRSLRFGYSFMPLSISFPAADPAYNRYGK
jgi:hypothetical protein